MRGKGDSHHDIRFILYEDVPNGKYLLLIDVIQCHGSRILCHRQVLYYLSNPLVYEEMVQPLVPDGLMAQANVRIGDDHLHITLGPRYLVLIVTFLPAV